MMRFTSKLALLISVVAGALYSAAGCFPDPTDEDEASGSGAGSTFNPPVPNACAEGSDCNVGTERFCCSSAVSGKVFECVGGKYQVRFECDELAAQCDAALGVCNCAVGSTQCTADQQNSQVCVDGLGGVNVVQTLNCENGCDPDTGLCLGDCFDICVPGSSEPICDPNLTQVLTCQKGPNFCAGYFPEFSCSALNMKCVQPFEPLNDPLQYCVNECGGRGVELPGKVCDDVPGSPCATFVCGADKVSLVPDHTACKGGGLSCTTDEECNSCYCDHGVCSGDYEAYCPPAFGCGKKD